MNAWYQLKSESENLKISLKIYNLRRIYLQILRSCHTFLLYTRGLELIWASIFLHEAGDPTNWMLDSEGQPLCEVQHRTAALANMKEVVIFPCRSYDPRREASWTEKHWTLEMIWNILKKWNKKQSTALIWITNKYSATQIDCKASQK